MLYLKCNDTDEHQKVEGVRLVKPTVRVLSVGLAGATYIIIFFILLGIFNTKDYLHLFSEALSFFCIYNSDILWRSVYVVLAFWHQSYTSFLVIKNFQLKFLYLKTTGRKLAPYSTQEYE